MSQLYIGTSGWSYKDWIGSFYPPAHHAAFDMLEFYSDYFNSVEVNSTYYSYISPKTAEGWIKKIEHKEDFLFTIKLHNDFTHVRKYSKDNIKSVKALLDVLNNAGRLGGLLVQFPYSFIMNKENAYHLKYIIDDFSEYHKFIEVRHKSWLLDRFFNFVRENNSSLCTIDQPILGEAIDFKMINAGENSYIRLHGRNENAWIHSLSNFGKDQTEEQKNARYDYLYSPAELAQIGLRIRPIMENIKRIFIFFNNHPKGNAVANAFELLHFLKNNIGLELPETTLKAYPRLSRISAK